MSFFPWPGQIHTMLTTARGLRRFPHPELLALPPLQQWNREPAWNLTLDAASAH